MPRKIELGGIFRKHSVSPLCGHRGSSSGRAGWPPDIDPAFDARRRGASSITASSAAPLMYVHLVGIRPRHDMGRRLAHLRPSVRTLGHAVVDRQPV